MGRFKAFCTECKREVWIHDMYLDPFLQEQAERHREEIEDMQNRLNAFEQLEAARERVYQKGKEMNVKETDKLDVQLELKQEEQQTKAVEGSKNASPKQDNVKTKDEVREEVYRHVI